jgi:3D (Asp-Asp-Asp) domain-containing protein
VRQIQLLVALSLLLAPNAPATDDKHKQPPVRMRSKARKFLAFAYTSGRLTSEGNKPIAGTTIAADPSVLPMGTRVMITGAGEYSGVYTVSDKGSKIKGQKVDVFVGSYAEAKQFGRKQVYVAVLDRPEKTARARRQPGATVAECRGCGRKQPKAMIAIDEAARNNGNIASRPGAPGGVGTGSGGSDTRKAGDSSSFAGVSAIEGAPLN